METHSTENTVIDIDNVVSDIPSENDITSNEMMSNGTIGNANTSHGMMGNGSRKGATFSQDTISISESVIAQKNIHTAKQEEANQENTCITLEKSCLPTTLITLMLLIVMILQIPTILYYTDPPSAEPMLNENINLETCSVDNTSTDLLQSLSTTRTPLRMLCNESKIYSDRNGTDNHKLYSLLSLYGLSGILGIDHCGEAALQFFCNAINAIDSDNYTLITECLEIRDDKCAAEWRIAENFLNISLPDCSSFDAGANFTTARAPVLGCPDDFGVFCGSTCQPLCDEISIFNEAATVAYEVLNIILHSLSLIGGVVMFLACCLMKRKMFSFPLIYVVYNTIVFEIISLFLLLPYISGSEHLLCSHPNLIVSTDKPTAFCQIQGLVVQSGALIFFGFWLFHLSHLLYCLVCPFKAELLKKSTRLRRNIHIIEVTITLVCGLLPSVVIIFTSGYQHSAFPPVCTHKIPEVLFYTLVFPISIGATIGLCMLLFSIVILRKHHHTNEPKMLRRLSMRELMFNSYSIPETKLIILFSYYGVTVVLLLVHLIVTLQSNDTAVENISNFALCSAGGYRAECDKYRETLNRNLTPAIVFDLISTLFLSFANIINLLYVMQYKDFKEAIKKVLTLTTSQVES